MADAGFNPDQYLAQKNAGLTPSPSNVPVDPLQLQQFNPDQYLNQKQNQDYERLQGQYGTLGQQTLAGTEAFARGASFGLSDALETGLGLSTPQDIRARQQANPTTSFLGSTAGGAATLGLTGGIAGPIEAGLGGGLAARVAAYGAEGSAFGLGNAISDASLGDPNLNGQKILSDIGWGAATGAGLGLFSKALGAVPALLRRGNQGVVENAAQDALDEAGLGRKVPLTSSEEASKFGAPGGADLRESLPIDALDPRDQTPIVEGLNNLKENAGNIIEAGRDLGAPTPEGMLSADEHIQKLDYALTNSPSPQGVARNRLYNEAYAKASQAVSDALGQGTDLSLAETGNQAKQLLSQSVEARYQPIRDLYSQIEDVTPQVPVSPQIKEKLGDSIGDIIQNESLIKGTPEHTFVSTFANGVDQVDQLSQLKNFRTALQRATGPETRYVSSLIKDKLDNVESQAIRDYAEQLTDPEMKQRVLNLTDQIDQAKSAYSGFRDEIGKVAKTLWGGKRIYGAQDFLDKVEEESPEKFASRLFSKNNSEALTFMGANFPEVTQLLSQFERSKIRAASLVKGEFSPVKAINNLQKISPEVKNLMFSPQELGKFDSGKIYFDNFLKNFNPSGTAGAIQYHEFLKNPTSSMINWAKDFGIQKFLEHEVNLPPELRQAAQQQADQIVKLNGIQGVIKRITNKISDGAEAIFSERSKNTARGAALGALTRLGDDEYDKHIAQLRSFSSNPQELMDHVADNTNSLYPAAPSITQSLHNAIMQGVQYLNSKIPGPPSHFPLSQPWEASEAQKTQFNHYYNGVNDPLSALADVKKGSLTSQKMEAISLVHPQLLQEMRQKVLEEMKPEQAVKLPTAQKIALSKFLGQPMDGNLTTPALISNQQSFNGQLSAQAAPKQGRKTNQGGLKQLNLASRTATKAQQSQEGEETS